MRLVLASLVVVLAVGCSKHEANGAAPPAQASGCANIEDLADVMKCELAPYMSNQTHDEAAFRKALEQLRDLAPSDPEFYSGTHPWPQIVQTMLDTQQYRQGCGECHRSYQKLYRSRFEGSQIPWTDVHAPPQAAAPAASK